MPLTISEKVEIIHLARRLSYQEAANQFNRLHPNRRPIFRQTVGQIFKCLRTHGSLERKKRSPSIQHAARQENLKEDVIQMFTDHPHMSTRRAAFRLGVSHASVWKILKELKFKPYKMAKHQKLQPDDPPKRKQFCQALLRLNRLNPNFRNTILWTDEKTFEMNGCFNRQNFR